VRDFVLGVIPARGGSKRAPMKNLRMLTGIPLVGHTIIAARTSHMLDRVVVSTDDERIAKTARLFGADVPFFRPHELSRDETPLLPVIKHAVVSVERSSSHPVDIVAILQPTSPFRTSSQIDAAIRKIIRSKADTVVSVCKMQHHPWWAVKVVDGHVMPFFSYRKLNTERQKLPQAYRETGGIYITKRHVLMNLNKLLGPDTRPIILDRISSLDIDDEADFLMAESLAEKCGVLRKKRASPSRR